MTADYNPRANVRTLRGRGGDAEYLDVKDRIAWFRHEHRDGVILTEHIEINERIAIFKATVHASPVTAFAAESGDGSATGHGSETPGDFKDYIEKAETKAIGRALAALGYGTQFLPEDGERIADAPVERTAPQTQREPPGHVIAPRSGNVIPRTAPMQAEVDRIKAFLADIAGAPDSEALYKIGTEMTAAGLTDEGLRDAYRKRKLAFAATA